MKITSKYCILLLKRFKTWLFSDPSCWSELVRDWNPPNTAKWRRLTKFVSSSNFFSNALCFALCISWHSYVPELQQNFLEFVSIVFYRIFMIFMTVGEYFCWDIIWICFLNYLWRRQVIGSILEFLSIPLRLCGLKMKWRGSFSKHRFFIWCNLGYKKVSRKSVWEDL